MDISKIGNNLMDSMIHEAKSSKVDESDFEARLQKAMDEGDKKALKQACADFESIFLSMLYKQMKATIPKSDLVPASAGRDIFESMLDEKIVEKAAESGGIGLADSLYKQLSKQAENRYKVAGEDE